MTMDHSTLLAVALAAMGLLFVGALLGWVRAARRADRLEHEVMLKADLLAQAGAPDRMQP